MEYTFLIQKRNMKYIDLTHVFSAEMPVYPGDPKPEMTQIAFADSQGYTDFKITSSMHVGTHMDAPLHMLKDGKKLSEYPPEHFFGKGVLLDARDKKIDLELLENKTITRGDIVFIMTGFYKKYYTPEYYKLYPEITEAFALKMAEEGIKIIGIDTPSPDRPPYRIHKLLMKNDILIIENLTNLEELRSHAEFDIVALPAKFDAEAAPVRVVACLAS